MSFVYILYDKILASHLILQGGSVTTVLAELTVCIYGRYTSADIDPGHMQLSIQVRPHVPLLLLL